MPPKKITASKTQEQAVLVIGNDIDIGKFPYAKRQRVIDRLKYQGLTPRNELVETQPAEMLMAGTNLSVEMLLELPWLLLLSDSLPQMKMLDPVKFMSRSEPELVDAPENQQQKLMKMVADAVARKRAAEEQERKEGEKAAEAKRRQQEERAAEKKKKAIEKAAKEKKALENELEKAGKVADKEYEQKEKEALKADEDKRVKTEAYHKGVEQSYYKMARDGELLGGVTQAKNALAKVVKDKLMSKEHAEKCGLYVEKVEEWLKTEPSTEGERGVDAAKRLALILRLSHDAKNKVEEERTFGTVAYKDRIKRERRADEGDDDFAKKARSGTKGDGEEAKGAKELRELREATKVARAAVSDSLPEADQEKYLGWIEKVVQWSDWEQPSAGDLHLSMKVSASKRKLERIRKVCQAENEKRDLQEEESDNKAQLAKMKDEMIQNEAAEEKERLASEKKAAQARVAEEREKLLAAKKAEKERVEKEKQEVAARRKAEKAEESILVAAREEEEISAKAASLREAAKRVADGPPAGAPAAKRGRGAAEKDTSDEKNPAAEQQDEEEAPERESTGTEPHVAESPEKPARKKSAGSGTKRSASESSWSSRADNAGTSPPAGAAAPAPASPGKAKTPPKAMGRRVWGICDLFSS